MAKKPKKDVKGQWVKGQSGNPTGRPKTHKLTGKDKEELGKVIEGRDVQAILAFLCERADTVTDAFKYVKEFAPYLAPKLQTINSVNKTDNTITIEWKSEVLKKVDDIEGEYAKLLDADSDQHRTTVLAEEEAGDFD
jgi:hypothetical protein